MEQWLCLKRTIRRCIAMQLVSWLQRALPSVDVEAQGYIMPLASAILDASNLDRAKTPNASPHPKP